MNPNSWIDILQALTYLHNEEVLLGMVESLGKDKRSSNAIFVKDIASAETLLKELENELQETDSIA
jgi:hypothetical protein